MPANSRQLSVSITPHFSKFIRDKVKSGRYSNASEVVAGADLDSIWGYIAERSSAQIATDFFHKFYEAFTSTAASPRPMRRVVSYATGTDLPLDWQ